MFNEQEKSILQKAIETYGVNAQIDIAVEEMAELTKALMKHRRNEKFKKDDFNAAIRCMASICGEIADVLIMLEQLQMIFDNRGLVEKIKEEKIQRLENRLREAQNEQSVQQ